MAVEAALEHVVEIGIDAGMEIIDAGEFCVFTTLHCQSRRSR